MVHSEVVRYPKKWKYGEYNEIMNPKDRYTIIDLKKLTTLLRVNDTRQLRREYDLLLEQELEKGSRGYTPDWSRSIAVGSEAFVSENQNKLGVKAVRRKIDDSEGHSLLHEPGVSYN